MLRISEFILNFVLNSVWQVTAIFVVAAVASWLLRNGPARYRHTLWIIALLASLVVPLLTVTRVVPEWIASFQVVAAPSQPENVVRVESPSGSEFNFTVDHTSNSRRSTTVKTTQRSVLFLSLGYLIFILLRVLRLARFWRRKEKLRRSASRAGVTPEIDAAAQQCRDLLRVAEAPVSLSARARVPYTIGTLRPLIVLPEVFNASVNEARLLSVIGHETAHVARRDFLTNLICEFAAVPVSFHPLTFLIKQQIERTRELACDELVTSHILAPRVYARSLLWAADVSRHYASQAFMLSIFDAQILEERIKRIMRSNTRIGARLARTLMFAAVLVLSFSALSLSLFSVELQTRVRAAVTQSFETPEHPVAQTPSPAPQTVTTARREPQASATDADERAASACNASKQGDARSIELLIAMLGDDRKSQLIRCWENTRWSPALEVFKQSSPGEQAALALASLGPLAFRPLANQLDNSNPSVRRNAAWAIGELTNMPPSDRSDSVPQLITLLSDSDAWVRMAAARALGELHDHRAVAQLIATLSDSTWRVRELVVWALSETKDARAVTALCTVLLSDSQVEVRRGAAEALGEIASAEALPALKQALQDSEPGVRGKAAWAISEIEG
ncbi:MAG TPA: M56 family metallopeptidase [Pyrinomonadaceae bacterium]|nr:M56 family metallopeptidase [Pyrinomonadaceae bacterium]